MKGRLHRIKNIASDRSIVVALGANLTSSHGAPEIVLAKALRALNSPDVQVTGISRFYRTTPVPASNQPDFINAAALIETGLAPRALLSRFHAIERSFGRRRTIKWEARVLDLDLIAYGGRVLPENWPGDGVEDEAESDIIIPHPHMHERAFVLVPMRDVAPGWRHPILRKTVTGLLARLDDADSPQLLDFDPLRT